MSKAIEGAALIGAAVGVGAVAALLASSGIGFAALPFLMDASYSLALGGLALEAGAIAGSLGNVGSGYTIRQPAPLRQIILGQQRVGGVFAYISTSGSHLDQNNFVIVLAGHSCAGITGLYLDGRQVQFTATGAGWTIRNGVGFGGNSNSVTYTGPGGATYDFGGVVYCEPRYGDQTLTGAGPSYPSSYTSVIGGLYANDPVWGPLTGPTTPTLMGCTYAYLKLEYNTTLFPNTPGSVEVKFTVLGNDQIWDPRTGLKSYSCNPALLLAWVILDTEFGLGDVYAFQDAGSLAQLIAAANICDEQVYVEALGQYEARYACHYHYDTSVAPGDVMTEILKSMGGRISQPGGEWYIYPAAWVGPSFSFDAGSLVGPLKWNPLRSQKDLSNRVRGTYIAPNFPWNVAGNQYDANGFFMSQQQNNFNFAFQPCDYPQFAADVLHGNSSDAYLEADSNLLGAYSSSTAYNLGDVVSYSGVMYKSLAAANLNHEPDICSAPGGPTTAYAGGTTYAIGNEVVYAGQNYISLTNGNTGNTPSTSTANWAPVVWVAYSNLLPMDLSFRSVLSVTQAQRLAKIALLRNRFQGSGSFPMAQAGFAMQCCDVMSMTFPAMGWSARTMEIVGADSSIDYGDENTPPFERLDIRVAETDASIYDWDPATEEMTVYNVPANTNPVYAGYPPSPPAISTAIADPTGLTLTSSSATAIIAKDGTVTPQILAAWTAPADVRVVQIQIQYQLVGASSWTDDGTVAASIVSTYIAGVIAGQSYNVQIRSLAANGAVGNWVTTSAIAVAAPNSMQNAYANTPALALTQPTSTAIHVAAVAASFNGAAAVNYAVRTLTIPAPSVATWYYVTIADPSQQGESGSPTLTATASTANSLVGVSGNTFVGAILALPAGSATREIAGGWPNPQTFQVVP